MGMSAVQNDRKNKKLTWTISVNGKHNTARYSETVKMKWAGGTNMALRCRVPKINYFNASAAIR